jgi:probable DNA metabolism protein
MPIVRLTSVNDFIEWRAAARQLLRAGVKPNEVTWADPSAIVGLFDTPAPFGPAGMDRPAGRVTRRFVALARTGICHSDPDRFALLYRLLWRLQKDRAILRNPEDIDGAKLNRRVEAVLAEVKRMEDELRFRRAVAADGQKGLAANFAPRHFVLELVAPHFARSHRSEHWRIDTPYRSCWWDGRELAFGPGRSAPSFPAASATGATTTAPSPFSLPEGTRSREAQMTERTGAPEERSPVRAPSAVHKSDAEAAAEIASLADARAAVQGCGRCPLYEHATQAVFGEGPARAEVMFVGEQPGDQEDLQGRPFVGPAGKVFDAAMEEAGFDRRRTYVTNAVKHFKFVPRGKRRLHQKPNGGEIAACRFWLNLEREFVRPKVIVALGVTAINGILGKAGTISGLRGEPHQLEDGTTLFVTIHPSYLLRMRTGEDLDADAERRRFVEDLRMIRDYADKVSEEPRRKAS